MSDDKLPKPKASKEDTTAKPDSAKKSESSNKSDSGTKPENSSAGKSARESIGGAKEVHYGYFSNVKSPEYLDGWDSIWGNKKGGTKEKSTAKKTASRKPITPVNLSFDLDDLSVEVREGLVAAAKAELKKSRVNYDKRDAAGAVDWQIECWVKRA